MHYDAETTYRAAPLQTLPVKRDSNLGLSGEDRLEKELSRRCLNLQGGQNSHVQMNENCERRAVKPALKLSCACWQGALEDAGLETQTGLNQFGLKQLLNVY